MPTYPVLVTVTLLHGPRPFEHLLVGVCSGKKTPKIFGSYNLYTDLFNDCKMCRRRVIVSRDKVAADGWGTSATGLRNVQSGAGCGAFFVMCTTVTSCVSVRVSRVEVAYLATMIAVRGVHLANAANVDVSDRRLSMIVDSVHLRTFCCLLITLRTR